MGVSISARCNEVVDHCYSLIVVYILYSPHFVWIWQKEWHRKHIHAHAWFPVITHRGQQSAILFERVPLGGFCRLFVYSYRNVSGRK